MDKLDELTKLIVDFIQMTPPETIQEVIHALDIWENDPWELSKSKLLSGIHSPQVKTKLTKLLNYWRKETPQLPAIALAISVRSSLITLENTSRPFVGLVWTGPETPHTQMRRTDQALLELIHGAKQKLSVVSFAVYKAETIIQAIEEAIMRGVDVHICLEDHDESKGKITFSGIKAFSSSMFRLANFYCWPTEKRSQTEDGKVGALHAKFALADKQCLFVTSANLTDYALELNIEMGVLINDSKLGTQVDDLFNELIIRGVFQRISL